MLKVGRRWQFRLTLPGLVLLVALLINGGIIVLLHANSPIAEASDGHDCTGTLHEPSLGGAVIVDSHEVICSNVTSFGGTTVIRGIVKGNIVSFGGNVIIAGGVEGNIYLYGGNVTLQDGTQLNGDIHLCNGQLAKGTTIQFHGNVYGCSQSIGQLLIEDGGGFGFRFWSILTWLGVGILLIVLLPEHVMLVRTTILSKMRRSFFLGLLSAFLAPVVLAILFALIVSIPLAILVALALIAAWALGIVALGWVIGDYILQRIAPQQSTRLLQVIVGLTILVLAGSLPYVGWLINIGAGMIGLGAVFLSRFGTRLYSQPRQPLTL